MDLNLTNIYEWADNSINSCPQCKTGFTQLLACAPYIVSPRVRESYDSRLPLIRDFQETAIRLFKDAIRKNSNPELLHWLLNETPNSLGFDYHSNLEDRHYTVPVFFRTDEVAPGRIIEIQCPGSLWGELQLTYDYTLRLGKLTHSPSPADQFIVQLTDFMKRAPIVHHMLDNASMPAGMRFFIERTRPRIQYWGIDFGIQQKECNFIRSHSFFGLCAENEFHSRLRRVGRGVSYDLPPHVLFDQKATLALPFWSLTRGWFSDEIRSLFAFTTPLLPSGIELPDGTRVSIEEFSSRSRSQRSYYLKYAGSDVSINWGSKAVYRLSNMNGGRCLSFLRHCVSQFERGRIWLIQQAEAQDDPVSFLARDGAIQTETLRAKFSAFYGPAGCLGVLAMHRHHNKVHGQPDTVISHVMVGD